MKRIEPEKVPDVFRRLDLKPATGVFVGDVEQHQCCILSALYCEATACTDATACLTEILQWQDGEDKNPTDLVTEPLGLEDKYAGGLMYGWDSGSIGDGYTEAWAQGNRDGVDARKAVLAAGMPMAILEMPANCDDEEWDEEEFDLDDDDCDDDCDADDLD
jgi:hypothetical protein